MMAMLPQGMDVQVLAKLKQIAIAVPASFLVVYVVTESEKLQLIQKDVMMEISLILMGVQVLVSLKLTQHVLILLME